VLASCATIAMFIIALVSLVTLTIGFIYDFMNSLSAVELEIKCGIENDMTKYSISDGLSETRKNLNHRYINFQNIAKPFWIM
jgi:hypothetical protein